MFDLSTEKIFVLGVVALFILGPERLPAAAQWLGNTIRQVKGYAAGAREHLERPEVAELRETLNELRGPLQDLRTELGANSDLIETVPGGKYQLESGQETGDRPVRTALRTVTDTAPTCGAACGAPPAPAPADVPREFPPGDQCRGGVVVVSRRSHRAGVPGS